MQVFEFHFNPKLKPDLIFDSFCYEPENIYERRVGSLYMAGILKNALPQNFRLLNNLAKVIKENYYRPALHSSEKQLKESLKTANEFLEKIAKSGDVSWLGNLSFATISLRNSELNFTKVGDLKIFLLRGGGVIDIDRKLRFQDITPWPLKIFGNIISGKLAENDIILVLTKEVLEIFQNQNLLTEIAKAIPLDERKLKEILKTKSDELSKVSGVCLLIFLSKETGYPAKDWVGKKEIISPQFHPKEFSLKEVFTPHIKNLCAGFSPILNYLKKLIKKPRLGKLVPKLPKLVIPKLSKNLISILVLIFFLVLGSLIFQRERAGELREYQTTLNQIQEKVNLAESFLILKEVKPETLKDANSLLKECWEEIYPLTKIGSSLPKDLGQQISSLENEISKNLYEINKLVEIPEPKLLFEFNRGKFIPSKLVSINNNLYFFSPYSQNLFKISGPSEAEYPSGGELIQIEKKFNLATPFDDSILFFLKPNQLVNFKDGQFSQALSLEEPYPEGEEDKSSSLPFAVAREGEEDKSSSSPSLSLRESSVFDDFSSFKSNLYFLDKKKGEIIKYLHFEDFEWGFPQLWLDPKTKKATEAKSMAVDGSLWILNKDNSIGKYYAGRLQETLKLDIFPYPNNFSKILASPVLPYLYLLEPAQSRIIILNKTGQVIKQFQSKKFDNLLDFSVSKDGKTIYLLNGLKVYKIQTADY